jgi:hypothetical protein
MTSADQARLLAAKSDEDIHVLTVLRDDQGTSDTVRGFHAQQAVEKLLKALLAFYGIQFPYSHRLLELADLLADASHPVTAEIEPLLDLTPYAVEFRYAVLANAAEPSLDRAGILRLVTKLRGNVRDRIEG